MWSIEERVIVKAAPERGLPEAVRRLAQMAEAGSSTPVGA